MIMDFMVFNDERWMGGPEDKKVAVIVAHPDDETLWAGGLLLTHPKWDVFVVCVCRGDDPDRVSKFQMALKTLHAKGAMGLMDDGVEQKPLQEQELRETILKLLPLRNYDLVITHNPSGEYTYHRRHEEISRAVIKLWHNHSIKSTELWTFAYDDGGKQHHPRATKQAPVKLNLTLDIYRVKHEIINEVYGFPIGGWEESTTPCTEAFWPFKNSKEAIHWLHKGGVLA